LNIRAVSNSQIKTGLNTTKDQASGKKEGNCDNLCGEEGKGRNSRTSGYDQFFVILPASGIRCPGHGRGILCNRGRQGRGGNKGAGPEDHYEDC